MGFKISWIGFEGLIEPSLYLPVLSEMGFNYTNQAEHNESLYSFAVLPTGWAILFINDFSFVSDEKLIELSQNRRVVGCQIHEGIMCSTAASYAYGAMEWRVEHEGDEDSYQLEETGSLPPIYAEIRARLFAEQEAGGGKASEVDFIFDCPTELAEAITGYKHDRWEFSWGVPEFISLESNDAPPRKWWQKLFG